MSIPKIPRLLPNKSATQIRISGRGPAGYVYGIETAFSNPLSSLGRLRQSGNTGGLPEEPNSHVASSIQGNHCLYTAVRQAWCMFKLTRERASLWRGLRWRKKKCGIHEWQSFVSNGRDHGLCGPSDCRLCFSGRSKKGGRHGLLEFIGNLEWGGPAGHHALHAIAERIRLRARLLPP